MDAWSFAAATLARLPDLRGKGWLAHRCFERAPRRGEWHIKMQRGHRMVVPRSARQGWEAAFTGGYDDAIFEVVRRFIPRGSTVLDVGASVGFWTLNLALHSGAGHVLSFEPVLDNVHVLEQNLRANGASGRVSVCRFALGAVSVTAVVVVERGGVGNAQVLTCGVRDAASRAFEIPLRPLDSVPLGNEPVSFVKIDVEGMDVDVLTGAGRLVETHRPVILGEFNRTLMSQRGIDGDAPMRWAAEHSYQVFEVARSAPPRWKPLASRPVALVELERHADRQRGDLLLMPR